MNSSKPIPWYKKQFNETTNEITAQATHNE